MKKILFISPQPFFRWRGSPIRVYFNILALTQTGYKVDLLTLPFGEEKQFENSRIIRVANPLGIKDISIGPSPAKIFFDLLLLLKGIRLCLKNKYDVIHGVEEAGLIASVLARIFSTGAIFEKHSDPFSYRNGLLKNFFLTIYSKIEKITARLCDAVIGTGEGLVCQVEQMGVQTRAFHIFDIPSSLEEPSEEQVELIRGQLIANEGEILITFVGSFALYQGVDLMFAAIPRVVVRNNKIRFIIIGGTEEEIREKKEILRVKNVDHSVTFLGKISPDSLPGYLKASDILLSPRLTGINTPLKILDYMKAGKPIVATDVPAHRLLLDETTASFAPPDPQQVTEAILLLTEDKSKREEMGMACRRLYETRYNFENYKKQLESCYQYVLKHKLS